MKIEVTIPKFMNTQMKRVELNEENFKSDLLEFINDVENLDLFNEDLYNKIVNYGVNKQEFDKMLIELHKFAEYDDDKDHIGFPYESWIDKLLQVYTNSDIDKI